MTRNMLNVLALIHFGVDVTDTYPARANHRRHLIDRFVAEGLVALRYKGPTLTKLGLNLLKHATKRNKK